MANFMNAMKETLNNEKVLTENGAVAYRTTGKELLDLNFSVASLRNATIDDIVCKFERAFFENRLLAMKWLFYARDIRGGLGERRLFRAVIQHMSEAHPRYILPLLSLVPEYGRWDDLWCLLDTPNGDAVIDLVAAQLDDDIRNANRKKNISLLAKWMPREKASSYTSRRYAQIFAEELDMMYNNKYQHTLSDLCRYLDVVEHKMAGQKWDAIDYQKVPSRANLIYNKAFLRHDEERRRDFLNQVEAGTAKINSSVLFPHDIVSRYRGGVDQTLEALWNALPDTVDGCDNTIVVADGSGSMMTGVGNTQVTALDVATSLAIYFAERSSGDFKNKYITFSTRPKFVDLSKARNLHEKLRIAWMHNECANTNIQAVFELILQTAIENRMSQDDLPKNILVISDMEFDSCVTTSAYGRNSWACVRPTRTLFESIEQEFLEAGYKIPRMVFWNVCSRTGTIPVKENDLGVALVSGFSPNIARMVMSDKLDPYECLIEMLNSDRYKPIEEGLINLR